MTFSLGNITPIHNILTLTLNITLIPIYNRSRVTRKPVFGVFNQVRLKPACAATCLKFRKWKLEELYYLGSEQQWHWSDCTDAQTDLRLLSVCAFVVRIWHNKFSHDVAHIIKFFIVLVL